jgi:hypothetical protein
MILACSNGLGNNKLKLPFIGKYEKPYASKTYSCNCTSRVS